MTRLVDDLMTDQRRRWERGEARWVEEYLADHPALADDDEGVIDLVYQEFVLRTERESPPSVEEYYERFPRYRGELQAQLNFLVAVRRLAARMTMSRESVGATLHGPTPESVPTPAADPAAPAGYEILGELGRGSTGVVYRAWQRQVRRLVALKMLHPTRALDPQARARFRREAEAVARLQHPHIVQLHDAGEYDGRPYFVMEFVEGTTLDRRLESGPLPPREAAALIEVLARAMQHAHRHGIVHRDLKPANVLLSLSGGWEERLSALPGRSSQPPFSEYTAKIADFGLARQLNDPRHPPTETGAILGTPSYMAPEQADGVGRPVGPAADVYGLGAILYELLTGRPPFLAATPLETLRQALAEEPLPPRRLQPALPRDLDTICLKCLAKDPARRYASAEALADDLGRHLRGEAIRARPVGLAERGWRLCRRHPGVAGLTVVLLLAVVMGFAGILYQWRRAEAARGDAEASDAEAQQLLRALIRSSPIGPWQTPQFPGLPDTDTLLRAETYCRDLLAKQPDDLERRIALTRMRGILGTVYSWRGQPSEAADHFRQAGELWGPLVSQQPFDPEYRTWLATTNEWQASSVRDLGDYARAQQLYQEAAALWEELVAEQPNNLTFLQAALDSHRSMMGPLGTRKGREELHEPLEADRARLAARLHAAPGDKAVQRRLALTCFLLGDVLRNKSLPAQAAVRYRQAYDHYLGLTQAAPDDLLVQICLAESCCRLMRDEASDPMYQEAVARLEQLGPRLTRLSAQHPDGHWLLDLLLDNRLALAVCHWRAGEDARAEQIHQHQVQLLLARVSEHPTDARSGVRLLNTLCTVGSSLWIAQKPDAARVVARRAAALATQYLLTPSRDLEFGESLASQTLSISALLTQLEVPAEALPLAEQSRRLYEGLCRAAPDLPIYQGGLSNTWERIGKVRWKLGQGDEALAAFRESAAIAQRIFNRWPAGHLNRLSLGRCQDRLFYWNMLRADRTGAVAALRERERLWAGDANELRKVASDFADLADSVGADPCDLPPEEVAERQRYLAESERVWREVQGLRQGANHTPSRER